jgi:hypothetical protein
MLSRFKGDYSRGTDWILDLLTSHGTRNYNDITDVHTFHIATAPFKPFSSLLCLPAVPGYRLLTVDILQLPTFRSSCHSRPCRTLVNSLSTDNCQLRNPQSNSLLQLPIISLPSLLNYLCRALLSTAILNWLSQLLSAGLGSSLYSLGTDASEDTVFSVIAQQYLDCCLRIRCRGNVFTKSLPSNECLLWLHYSGFQASCHDIINYKTGLDYKDIVILFQVSRRRINSLKNY